MKCAPARSFLVFDLGKDGKYKPSNHIFAPLDRKYTVLHPTCATRQWCARETTNDYRRLIEPIPHPTLCSAPSGSHPPPTVLSHNPRQNSIPGVRSTYARKKKPVDGTLRESYTWSPKSAGVYGQLSAIF